MKVQFWILCSFLVTVHARGNREEKDTSRQDKLLPVFQIVRFPNDPCSVSAGGKNGTCYTNEECQAKGGSNMGTCASGFGVCCSFTVGCGQTSSENCTYVEASSLNAGSCRTRICPCSNNICQMRLDFNTFVITGPSTETASTAKILNGAVHQTGVEANQASTCATDVFTITNAENLPELCGTLTGEHVYFDADNDCHDLAFALGQTGVDASIPTNRQVSIKVTQYSCDYNNLAPQGCDQYYFGSGATGTVKTFNYDAGRHLANQDQHICVRREINNCRICWSADTITDVALSGANTGAVIKQSSCCGYGSDGKKTNYDCIMIPGAMKVTTGPNTPVIPVQCGGGGGLVTASAGTGNSKTVCSTTMPFSVSFVSDAWEGQAIESMQQPSGFQLRYFQTGC